LEKANNATPQRHAKGGATPNQNFLLSHLNFLGAREIRNAKKVLVRRFALSGRRSRFLQPLLFFGAVVYD